MLAATFKKFYQRKIDFMKRRILIEEERLIKGLKAQNPNSFSILYNNYAKALRDCIAFIIKNDSETQNLVQDSFIKIWQNIEQYDESRGRLFTWIVNIGRNVAKDFLRSRRYIQQGYNLSLELISTEDGFELYPSNSLNYIGFEQIINKLEPNQKQVIDLIYFTGWTHEQAAAQLKLPLGTVKSRSRLALQQLKIFILEEQLY